MLSFVDVGWLAAVCIEAILLCEYTTLHSSQIGIGNGYDDEAISTSKLEFNWILSSLTGGVVVCARSRRREEKNPLLSAFQSINCGGWRDKWARKNREEKFKFIAGISYKFSHVCCWLAGCSASIVVVYRTLFALRFYDSASAHPATHKKRNKRDKSRKLLTLAPRDGGQPDSSVHRFDKTQRKKLRAKWDEHKKKFEEFENSTSAIDTIHRTLLRRTVYSL